MEREIRYCTAEDGVRIAYAIEGKGPALLVCPDFVESFSLQHLLPMYELFMRRLGVGRTLIRYDTRGTGLSQRELTHVSLGAFVADIRAVAEAAADLGRISVWAPSAAGPRAIQYAAENEERVAALILYATWARATDFFSPQALQGLAGLASANWPMAARAIADGSARAEAGDAIVPQADLFVQSASGELVARLMMGAAEFDVTPLLSKVRARTLIIHRRMDSFIPFAMGQMLAAAVPNARLVTPPGTMHGFFLGDSDSIINAVNAFLDEDAETRRDAQADRHGEPGAPPKSDSLPSGTAIILFADIVDSTALTERLGDDAFREKARGLDEAMRAAIRENGGTAVEGKTLGDGVLAVFTSAKQAIGCAQACHEAASVAGLALHAGIHAGDVIREENNVYGGAVNIAARISGLSAPGEVLVSDTVRSLARTSAGVVFEDRGEQALKGVGEAVRVFVVRQA